MAGSLNKVDAVELYVSGNSIPEVSEATGLPRSTLRSRLARAGVLRSRGEGIGIAAQKGRLGSGLRGKTRNLAPETCEKIRVRAVERAAEHAEGVSVKTGGYVEFTTGPNKGRGVHVVVMEARLGRPLLRDECVHHIDGEKHNNRPNNLALVTRSGHQRLHKYEENIARRKK